MRTRPLQAVAPRSSQACAAPPPRHLDAEKKDKKAGRTSVLIIELPERLPFAGRLLRRHGTACPHNGRHLSSALPVGCHPELPCRPGARQGVFGGLSAGVTGGSRPHDMAETLWRTGVTAFVLAGRDRLVSYPGQRASREDPGSTTRRRRSPPGSGSPAVRCGRRTQAGRAVMAICHHHNKRCGERAYRSAS